MEQETNYFQNPDSELHSSKNFVLDMVFSLRVSYLIPLIVILVLITIFNITNSVNINLLILLMNNFLILLVIFPFYRSQYKSLFNYSIEVGYVHFKPSFKDVLLSFYGSIFSVVILILVILYLLGENLEFFSLSDILIYSVIFASIFHIFNLIILTNAKNKLIKTAMEPLDPSLLSRIHLNIPGSDKIEEYRFADIKPASLFLTAGVTKYKGSKNICLVSRYFQWKLTEDELFSVISHEVGHVNNSDLRTNYLVFMLDFLIRVMYYTSVIYAIKNLLFPDPNLIIFFELVLMVNIGVIILCSLLVKFILQYRAFNQEIKADKYGSTIVGNYVMANTLKKLPSAIPAPVSDNPLEFLGFRVAILRNRGKNLNEEMPTAERGISRFSNN